VPLVYGFYPVVDVTVRGQNQDGSGDLLSSLLPPLSCLLRKYLIEIPGKLLLGGERECLKSCCYKCITNRELCNDEPSLVMILNSF
jgi:hypothetical protein